MEILLRLDAAIHHNPLEHDAFIDEINAPWSRRWAVIRCDNGPEYIGGAITA